MPITLTGTYDNDQPVVDYSLSYSTPETHEPAPTLENMYPEKFPIAECVMSLDCSCACNPEDPEDPDPGEPPV